MIFVVQFDNLFLFNFSEDESTFNVEKHLTFESLFFWKLTWTFWKTFENEIFLYFFRIDKMQINCWKQETDLGLGNC